LKTSPESWFLRMSSLRQDGERRVASVTHVEPVSFEQVYFEHAHFVWRNALRLGVPASTVDDVVQDVFIVVQRRLSEFDKHTAMRSWIFGILSNVVRHYRRKARRKDGRCVSLEQDAVHEVARLQGNLNPSDQAEHAERVRLLETLLDKLDDDKRTLLVLSELEGWTLREIAEHLGSNINTVFSRLRAAKRAFDEHHRKWLAERGDVA
jgi:RNA polymerase sigma-70 factor (ECF subfamily)